MQSSLPSGVPVSDISLLTHLAEQIIQAADNEQLYRAIEAEQTLVDLALGDLTLCDQSLTEQSETSARMPILAGVSYKQQQMRMKSRPFSIAGVRMADSNIFYVNKDSQSVTANKPSFFFEPSTVSREPVEMRSVSPMQPASWDETADLRKANIKLEGLASRTRQLQQAESQRPSPLKTGTKAMSARDMVEAAEEAIDRVAQTRAAFDGNGGTATVLPVVRPEHFNPPKYPRRSNAARITFTKLAKHAADPGALQALVEEQQRRERLRITAKMKAFTPSKSSTLPRAIQSIKTVYAKLSAQSQKIVAYFRRLKKLEKEFFMVSR